MQFPTRDQNHITETSSFKIFSANIPDNWIIREVSERDYGIDCYIELVNTENQVTGKLISIQLKGTAKIKWTKDDYYTFAGINISTTNYWMKFPVPVILCLVDIDSSEVFFCAVKSSVRKGFYKYAKQDKFSYLVYKKNKLELARLEPFLKSFFNEKSWENLENNVVIFLANYHAYLSFIRDNSGRDGFMGVEIDRVMYLKMFYKNVRTLCSYLHVEFIMKPIADYFRESQEAFDDDYYVIHEHYIHILVNELAGYLPELALKIRDRITVAEREYWSLKDTQLFRLASIIEDDGSIPSCM